MAVINFNFPSVLIVIIYGVFQGISQFENANAAVAANHSQRQELFRQNHRIQRSSPTNSSSQNLTDDSGSVTAIWGMRIEYLDGAYANTKLEETPGVVTIIAETQAALRFFGSGFSSVTQVAFTGRNDSCYGAISDHFQPDSESLTDRTALFSVKLDSPPNGVASGERDTENFYSNIK